MVLTRRAAKLQQLCTSLGILQPAVLGFGVHGGPAACQTCVDKIFESMEEVKAFIDDLLVATGVSGTLEDPVDPCDPEAERAFVEHLETLERFLATAIRGRLRVKLDKCYFAQLVNAALGFMVGQRVRGLDPAKVNAVVVWPRPTMAGDCDRLLGFAGWLRSQCEAEFSAASAPLR